MPRRQVLPRHRRTTSRTFDTRPSNDRPIFEPIEEPRATRRAANDDRETIGQILQAIQKGRPARSVLYALPRVSPASGLPAAAC